MANLAKLYNNPMALIQSPPDKWQGLVGSTSSGFLKFKNNAYGARAGFINLVNAYLRRGLNTPAKITPVYAPKGHGNNDPKAYAAFIAKQMGITTNTVIQPNQLWELGNAIARVELGYTPNQSEMRQGFEMAIKRVGGNYMSDSSKKKLNLTTGIVLAAVGILAAMKLMGRE